MRAKAMAVVLLVLVAIAGYLYTQTELLDPSATTTTEGDELVAQSRRLQAEREQARRGHVQATMPDLPTEKPLVGPEGTDAWGYPFTRPDDIAMRALLLAERFDELTRFATEFEDEAEADYHKELWGIDAVQTFGVRDPRLTPLLDRWVEHSPKSFAPYWARAKHKVSLAWQVRGSKSVSKTAEARMERFGEMLEEANRDLERAIELRPAAIGPRLDLMDNAKALGVSLAAREKIREAAIRQCPKCYMPHRMWMYGLEPRWGGSWEAMDAYAKEAEKRVPDNPKVKVLAGMALADLCRTYVVKEDLAAARRACDQAVGIAKDNIFLAQRADVANRQERDEDALADVDRVLEQWPQHSSALWIRARVLRRLERYEDSARDMLMLRRLAPSNDDYRNFAIDCVRWIHAQGVDDYHDGRYEEAERLLLLGLELDPGHTGIQNALGHVRAKLGLGPLEARVAANPDDFRAIRDLDHALAAENRYVEVVPLWDDYLKRHPDDGRAYLERGGAYHHLGNQKQARADIERGCELGAGEACALAERFGWR